MTSTSLPEQPDYRIKKAENKAPQPHPQQGPETEPGFGGPSVHMPNLASLSTFQSLSSSVQGCVAGA